MLKKFARLLSPEAAVNTAIEEARKNESDRDRQTGMTIQFYWNDRPFAEGSYPLDTPMREIAEYAEAMGYEAEIVSVVR